MVKLDDVLVLELGQKTRLFDETLLQFRRALAMNDLDRPRDGLRRRADAFVDLRRASGSEEIAESEAQEHGASGQAASLFGHGRMAAYQENGGRWKSVHHAHARHRDGDRLVCAKRR